MPRPDMHRLRSAPTEKRIRAFAGGACVVDSRRARIVWVGPVARTYAVPRDDVRGQVGDADDTYEDIIAGAVPAAPLETASGRVPAAVLVPKDDAGLDGEVILNWNAMDAWFEEDDPVFVHPHDPAHRIDIRQSSRHVVVDIEGERLADTHRPLILFETMLPPRYYVPLLDVRRDLLVGSDERTGCAYKGYATYYHARLGDRLHEDVAWSYPTSFAEAARVQGLVAFYQERTDFTIDGEPLPRPDTPWRR